MSQIVNMLRKYSNFLKFYAAVFFRRKFYKGLDQTVMDRLSKILCPILKIGRGRNKKRFNLREILTLAYNSFRGARLEYNLR